MGVGLARTTSSSSFRSGTLSATLDADYGDHFLRARNACPGTVDIDCDYDGSSSTNDTIGFAVTQGASYYLIVDSWSNEDGGYSLTVEVQEQEE